jgi:hypothetical protein
VDVTSQTQLINVKIVLTPAEAYTLQVEIRESLGVFKIDNYPLMQQLANYIQEELDAAE